MKMGIAEIILLFILLFLIPVVFLLLREMRRLEQRLQGGLPPEPKTSSATRAFLETAIPPPKADSPPPPAAFLYQRRALLSAAEISFRDAAQALMGQDTLLLPKVSLSALVESADSHPAHAERLAGKTVDFLVCDRPTGHPTAAVFFQGAAVPRGTLDEAEKICKAANVSFVRLPFKDSYDAETIRKALGLPEL